MTAPIGEGVSFLVARDLDVCLNPTYCSVLSSVPPRLDQALDLFFDVGARWLTLR